MDDHRRPRRSKARSDLTPLAKRFRREMSLAERKLWAALRGRRFGGWKFRRQDPQGRFIADFRCPLLKLVIEVDGESHDATAAEDAKRTRVLKSMGLEVVRVKNEDVLFNLDGVLRHLFDLCTVRATAPSPQPSPPTTGERGPESIP